MNFFADLLGTLLFRHGSLQALASRRAVFRPLLCLAAGFLAYVLVRNSVYAVLVRSPYVSGPESSLEFFLDLNLLQILIFLSLIYVPALVALSNKFAGDGLGFSITRIEYISHLSAFLPLWGMLFLIAAPFQWLFPQFLVLGNFSISVGLLWLLMLMVTYTVWAVREMDYIPTIAALGAFALSWLTLPVFFILTRFLLALPFFILIPLLYIFVQRFRELMAAHNAERSFRRHLHSLTLNPRNADAHYQLGLLHYRHRNLDAAQTYFDQALAIDPEDPDYHYFLGRVYEARGDWHSALGEYETTYRLSPEYALGDIFREVGKAYLHEKSLDKAAEFLRFFLSRRASDPEGRYWLAVALLEAGDRDEARIQLNTMLDQARATPRFFRKENREWIHRARMLLHNPATRARYN